MVQGFKKFLFRGNVVDLAVAVVIGAAFGAVITALVTNIFTPLIAAIGGKPDFSNLSVTIHNSKIMYGAFLNALISFVMIALAVYLFIVAPMNTWTARRNKGEAPPDPSTKKCPECLSEIPIAARRCAFCTATLSGTSAATGR
jgi:large conductance mechanosensitive channel